MGAAREVICADALAWLDGRTGEFEAVVTSPPDAAEVGLPLERWAAWFRAATEACLTATADDGPCIFFVTDRKAGGATHSKAALVFAVAARTGHRLLWHKIVLRRPVGSTDLHRPGYSHLLAYSRTGRPGPAGPDVLDGGGRVYANGMPYHAARVAVAHAARTASRVLDPFCGRGTVLAVANELGLDATGVDIDAEQCAAARALAIQSRLAGLCP